MCLKILKYMYPSGMLVLRMRIQIILMEQKLCAKMYGIESSPSSSSKINLQKNILLNPPSDL